jgi:hypothetical protein
MKSHKLHNNWCCENEIVSEQNVSAWNPGRIYALAVFAATVAPATISTLCCKVVGAASSGGMPWFLIAGTSSLPQHFAFIPVLENNATVGGMLEKLVVYT